MSAFKLSKLHRQRSRRRNNSRILDQTELAEVLGVLEADLQAALDLACWDYHRDANGNFWASVPRDVLASQHADTEPDPAT